MIKNHYVMITQGSCPFCQEAIELLKSRELNFIYTDMEYAPEVLEITKLASGASTVPMIWEIVVGENIQQPADRKFIGGCEDLKQHLGVESTDE